MSRPKRDILDTEKMLERLREVLLRHRDLGINTEMGPPSLTARADAEALRRISMTLHNWHELECGNGQGCVERDEKTGKPLFRGYNNARVAYAVPDREAGALKRLKAIMARYPALQAYVQTDPRGCALYILKPGDVPEFDGWSVWCRDDDTPAGEPGAYVRATSKTFSTKEAAIEYMNGLALSRAPELRQVPADPSAYYSRGLAVHR